jgi:hypothetical protein
MQNAKNACGNCCVMPYGFRRRSLVYDRLNNKEESSQFNSSYAILDNFSLPEFSASDNNVSSVLIPHKDVNSVL